MDGWVGGWIDGWMDTHLKILSKVRAHTTFSRLGTEEQHESQAGFHEYLFINSRQYKTGLVCGLWSQPGLKFLLYDVPAV